MRLIPWQAATAHGTIPAGTAVSVEVGCDRDGNATYAAATVERYVPEREEYAVQVERNAAPGTYRRYVDAVVLEDAHARTRPVRTS